MSEKFKVGDRVMRSDVDEKSIPAYRDMRGTVVGFDWTHVQVKWDCDASKTSHMPEDLAPAKPSTKAFILWDPKDGKPMRADETWRDEDGNIVEERGAIISSGVLGRIGEDNAYLVAYAEYPGRKRPRELEVNESIQNVRFSLSGEKGYYDIYRVK